MSFILLLFRKVSIEKLRRRRRKEKSFSECLPLIGCAVLILSLMFHFMLHTNKVLGSSKVPCCSFFLDFKLCHVASSFQHSAEAFWAHCGGD